MSDILKTKLPLLYSQLYTRTLSPITVCYSKEIFVYHATAGRQRK